MIWDSKYECMDREQLRDLQSERLVKVIQRVYEEVPFYRQLFEQQGIEPEDIKGVDDISKLPFTTKDALRDNYPFGLFAEPMNKIVRLHASSGTTGKPIVVGYTRKDLDTWAELIARIVSQAGVTEEDVVQICFGYGLFTGGFGLHYGLEKVGTTIIPASVGNTRRQIMLMEDFGTTALVSTPSYALYMAEVIQELGIDVDRLKMRIGLFGAEPWSESMREQIQSKWGITATDNYGLSEIIGPGVSGECLEFKGLHISEDHFIPEIIDPDTGESLGFNQEGELVFTTLTKEGFPVIRYRTKDISILWDDVCACGRTTARMKKVTGRTDDMMIIRGVNVFPSQIESVLMEIKGLAPIYQIIVDRKGHLDNIEVQVEMEKDMFTGSFRDLEAMENKIRGKLNMVLSIDVRVKLVEPNTIQRSEGKAKRVIDKREI